MAWGVAPEGFNAKTLEQILSEIQDAQRAKISQALDLSTESPLGQINSIMATKLREVWELGQGAYEALSAFDATGQQLANLATATGTTPKGGTPSAVTCTCTLDVGTYLAGTLVVNVSGDPTRRFANAANYTASFGGAHDLLFLSEENGPVEALAGSLVIAEVVAGFTAVSNASDADLGTYEESDPDLRLRRVTELASQGSNTVASIVAAVSKIENVQSVFALENDTDTTDANGLPPHAIEVIVNDGVVPSASSIEIAQTIFDRKFGGGPLHGSELGTAVDALGGLHLIKFSRTQILPVYLTLTLQVYADDWVSADALKSQIVDWADAYYTQGKDVLANRVIAGVLGLPAVHDVTNIFIGTGFAPTTDDTIQVSGRQLADFDTSRISITHALVPKT